MIDLESMSKEELLALEKKLRSMDIHEKSKRIILDEELAKFGMYNRRLTPCEAIYMIADCCTNNFTKKKVRNGKTYDYRNSNVPKEKVEQYRKVIRGILNVIYGRE